MASQDDFLSLKDKSNNFVNNTSSDQYSNLNLNQNHQNSNAFTVISKSATINSSKEISNNDFTDSNNLQSKKCFTSWNKSTSTLTSNSILGEFDTRKGKDNPKSNNNNSTLSLHIAAYENSIEGKTDSLNNNENKGKQSGLSKNAKQFRAASKMLIQNPFELPRQQESNEADTKPEVAQFKASQKLLNPNQSNSSNEIGSTKPPVDVVSSIPPPFKQSNDLGPTQSTLKASTWAHQFKRSPAVEETQLSEILDDKTQSGEEAAENQKKPPVRVGKMKQSDFESLENEISNFESQKDQIHDDLGPSPAVAPPHVDQIHDDLGPSPAVAPPHVDQIHDDLGPSPAVAPPHVDQIHDDLGPSQNTQETQIAELCDDGPIDEPLLLCQKRGTDLKMNNNQIGILPQQLQNNIVLTNDQRHPPMSWRKKLLIGFGIFLAVLASLAVLAYLVFKPF